VPVGDPAYAYLDRLEELGVMDSVIMGQRPYSERELARLVRAAQASVSRRERPAAESLLVHSLIATLAKRFTGFSQANQPLRALDEIRLAFTGTNARRRGFPSNTNLQVEATIDPLALRRLGEPVPRGAAGYLELAHRADPLLWLSLNARERFALRSPSDTGVPRQRAELLLAGARARFRNVALTLGREQVAWGHGADDGLFIASDAPALDLISIAGDQPFTMPGPLRRLGQTQATLVVADLGASRSHSHSRLVAYKVSVRPTRTLELGGTFENHFGGAGSRSSPTLARLFDLLPFIDIFRRHNYTDTTRTLDPESDKVIGADVRLRLDRLGGLTLSGEWLIDDFDVHRVMSLLTSAGSHSFAVVIPRLLSPSVSMRLSAKHMGLATYSHGTLLNGLTTRGRLLGDELGPNAKAFGGELRWLSSPSLMVALEGRSAIYSDARYFNCPTGLPGCTEYVLFTISREPDELRDQVVGTLTLSPSSALNLFVRAGSERVRNQVGMGGTRHGYVADVAVRWQP
jgi:hypothetical protein